MKFSDLFVPKYMHSNPEVRTRCVAKLKDIKLLAQIAEKDEESSVRRAASDRVAELKNIEKIS